MKPKAEEVDLDALTPDPRNANAGTEEGRAMLARSVESVGLGRGVVADRDGVLIGGNKTVAAARAAGYTKAVVVETDGETLVVTKRTDLRLDGDDDRARRLAYLDNRTSELDLSWDQAKILEDLERGVDLSDLWTPADLEAMLPSSSVPRDPDAKAPTLADPRTRPGDLWHLGESRLLCGDATNPDDVARLLGGARPALMVTDPPYGVEYDPAWRNRDGLRPTERTGTVANDDRVDWREAWALFPGDVAYVWHASLFGGDVRASLAAVGLEARSLIIWAKPLFAISRGHYHWQHEPCWYAVRKGATAGWIGDRKQSTLWEMPLVDDTGKTTHGTQKPCEAMERPLLNHRGDVYDPFVGSGTTLIAAHRQGRRCFAMELDPAYVDAAVARWEAYTGEEASCVSA